MSIQWLLIGGPVVVGVVVAGTIILMPGESPCACAGREYPIDRRMHTYHERLAAFDAAHPTPTCPTSIAELDALPPAERPEDVSGTYWHTLPFSLECEITLAPTARTLTFRQPGFDRRPGTDDDIVYRPRTAEPYTWQLPSGRVGL